MKTIEERAKEKAELCDSCIACEGKGPDVGCSECESRGFYYGYVDGATEQREIDIEEGDIAQQENIQKAIDKQKKTDTYKAEMNFCIFCSSYDNCGARYSCETFEKFCKAIGG